MMSFYFLDMGNDLSFTGGPCFIHHVMCESCGGGGGGGGGGSGISSNLGCDPVLLGM